LCQFKDHESPAGGGHQELDNYQLQSQLPKRVQSCPLRDSVLGDREALASELVQEEPIMIKEYHK
jgi:hypothetical protein